LPFALPEPPAALLPPLAPAPAPPLVPAPFESSSALPHAVTKTKAKSQRVMRKSPEGKTLPPSQE
jgi:hypothetical protein